VAVNHDQDCAAELARRVPICIGAPQPRMRDLVTEIGIAERTIQMIISDLEEACYQTRNGIGRVVHD
jgi:hypothetical protein